MEVQVNARSSDPSESCFFLWEQAAGSTVYNEVADLEVTLPEQELKYVPVDCVGKSLANTLLDDISSGVDTAKEQQASIVLVYTDLQDIGSRTTVEKVIEEAQNAGVWLWVLPMALMLILILNNEGMGVQICLMQ